MKCQKCGKYDVTTHITEIVNGKKAEAYLCKYCGEEYNHNSGFHSIFKNNFNGFFEDFWKSPMSIQSQANAIQACPNCKSTVADIQSIGKLGCSECYNTFRNLLLPSLKNIHGSNTYKGNFPNHTTNTISEIEELKQMLALAVENQNFEKAAELRDKIKEMEA